MSQLHFLPSPINPSPPSHLSLQCAGCAAAGVHCQLCYHSLFTKRKEVDGLGKRFLKMFSVHGYRSRRSCLWRETTAWLQKRKYVLLWTEMSHCDTLTMKNSNMTTICCEKKIYIYFKIELLSHLFSHGCPVLFEPNITRRYSCTLRHKRFLHTCGQSGTTSCIYFLLLLLLF